MKKMLIKFPIIFFIVAGIASFVFVDEAHAIKKIPDGGARIIGDFMPEQNNVNPKIKRKWEKKQIPRGGKDPVLYSPTNGKNLIYDVYAGSTSQVKKRGFHITPSGNFITFDGWAIIKGHHHHAEKNQVTYIGFVNKKNSNDRLIYKTAMRANTSANKDIWDDKLNKCPSNAKNRPVIKGQSGACNMDYQFTQFRAYLDLRDLFGGANANKEWEMYIIKRVEDQVVYDQLVLPFNTKSLQWKNGKVAMRSGQDVKTLRMVGTDVVKRTNANGGGGPGNIELRYFAPFNKYQSTGLNETKTNRVAVWYRVNDNVNTTIGGRRYRATNENRWAASTFWEFGGSIATLSYKKTKANVTIQHIDVNTNKIIKSEKVTRTIGKNYNLLPKTRGTFKDKDGYEYVANPARSDQRFNAVINGNRTIKFYYQATAKVTVQHIDAKTNKIIKSEKVTRQYNDGYTLKPKTKGTFKDKDGNEYVASPHRDEQRFHEMIRGDTTIKFYYKAILPDPSGDHELPKTTEGKADGEAYWELRRTDVNSDSELYAEANFVPSGSHYAIRNIQHQVKLGDYALEKQEQPISFLTEPETVKDKEMQYAYEYEYTNYYRDNYECVDDDGRDYCYEWEYVDSTPVWKKGHVFQLGDTVAKGEIFVLLKLDHRYKDTIKKETIEEILSEDLLVARSDVYTKNKLVRTPYYESFEKTSDHMKSSNTLKTQSTLVIRPNDLKYKVKLPSGEHEESNFQPFHKGLIHGHYYPVDVDESLKEDLENTTEHDLGEYAISLQQSEMNDNGMKQGKRKFDMTFISDYFFLSEEMGFIVNYPVAYQLNRHLLYGEEKPNNDNIGSLAQEKMKRSFLSQTGERFMEPIMYMDFANNQEDLEKLQRYYIPISPTSELKPNTTYTNKILLENIGLSDVSWEYGQEFLFEHYLIGSIKDDAWIVEQSVSRIDDFEPEDVHTIIIKNDEKLEIAEKILERPQERMHKFRVVDRWYVDIIRNIIEGFN